MAVSIDVSCSRESGVPTSF